MQPSERIEVAPPRVVLALVLVAAALLLGSGIVARDLWPPDEPRYGAIAEELRSFRHGWQGLILLHLNGETYTQKPPLFFWLAALGGLVGGRVSELAARLPSALAGFTTLWLVAWLGRSMFRPRTGVLAAAVLLSVPSWVLLAVSARLDALFAAEITCAFAAAWRIDRQLGSLRGNRLLLHAAMGLGVLTKGPLALLLPVLGVVAYLGWERRLASLRRFATPGCAWLSLAPGLAWWVGSAALAPAGYAHASLWDNIVGRFFSGTAHMRPVWFYLEALPRGFLPWTLLWPAAWGRYRALARVPAGGEALHAWRFVLASIGTAFVFLSLSAGKRGVYLLPVYPLIAIVSADTLSGWLERGADAPRWLRRSLAITAAVFGALAFGSLHFDRVGAIEIPAAFGLLLASGLLLAWLVARAVRAHRGERVALVAAALCGIFSAQLAVHVGIYPALDARNSHRAIAEIARAATPADGAIAVYRNETLASGVAYYAKRQTRELRNPRELVAFFARGGRTLVVEDEDLPALAAVTPLREVGRGRIRQRLLLVVTPGT